MDVLQSEYANFDISKSLFPTDPSTAMVLYNGSSSLRNRDTKHQAYVENDTSDSNTEKEPSRQVRPEQSARSTSTLVEPISISGMASKLKFAEKRIPGYEKDHAKLYKVNFRKQAPPLQASRRTDIDSTSGYSVDEVQASLDEIEEEEEEEEEEYDDDAEVENRTYFEYETRRGEARMAARMGYARSRAYPQRREALDKRPSIRGHDHQHRSRRETRVRPRSYRGGAGDEQQFHSDTAQTPFWDNRDPHSYAQSRFGMTGPNLHGHIPSHYMMYAPPRTDPYPNYMYPDYYEHEREAQESRFMASRKPARINTPAQMTTPPSRNAEPVSNAPKPQPEGDPIEIVESYLGLLKSAKERELLEASRVLNWIEKRTGPGPSREQSPESASVRTESGRSDSSVSCGPSRVIPLQKSSVPQSSTRGRLSSRVDPLSFLEEDQESNTDSEADESSATSEYSLTTIQSNALPGSKTESRYTDKPRMDLVSQQNELQPSSGLLTQRTALQNGKDSRDTELEALRRDVSDLRMQLARQKSKWLGSWLYVSWKKSHRRPPGQGMQRLEWICDCGEEMYADFPITNISEHEQMLAFLTGRGSTTQVTSHNNGPPSDLESGTAFSTPSSMDSSTHGTNKDKAPVSNFGSGSTIVGTSSSQTLVDQTNNLLTSSKYLELCINVGKYETKLAEIQVKSRSTATSLIYTDAHLFQKIHERYFSFRKYSWRRLLYRPNGIRFVHFGVQSGQRVNFFAGDALPSEEVMAQKRYEYNLRPPVPPPMDSRTFLHYFWKYGSHSHSTNARYLDRLPKKVGDSLIASLGADDMGEGWGIHILEGPNKPAVCWMLLVILAASFGVSVGYDLITKNGDSGFAIGQWMVAALTVVLSALYFALEDDVDATFDSTYTVRRDAEWARIP